MNKNLPPPRVIRTSKVSHIIKDVPKVSHGSFEFDNKEWKERRNNLFKAITDNYSYSFFKDKTILELGAGYGYLGEMFRNIGSIVTALEGRMEHVEKGQYLHQNINFICNDLDKGWVFEWNDFDIILHIGVLYHLEKPELNLYYVCKSMKKGSILILETEFVDTDDVGLKLCLHRVGHNLSLNTFGCRPSHGMIENILASTNMSFKKMTSNKYDHPMYKYSIPLKNDGKFDRANRGFWFAQKT